MEEQRSLMVLNAIGLVKQCPAGNLHRTCSFGRIADRMSLRNSYLYLNALSDEEISGLFRSHMSCAAAACSMVKPVSVKKHMINSHSI